MIVENKSYQLNHVQIHHYLGKTELNFPRFGASAEEIDDLLEVSMLDNNDDTTDLHSVTIIAVTKLETTFNCRKNLPCDPNNTITNDNLEFSSCAVGVDLTVSQCYMCLSVHTCV